MLSNTDFFVYIPSDAYAIGTAQIFSTFLTKEKITFFKGLGTATYFDLRKRYGDKLLVLPPTNVSENTFRLVLQSLHPKLNTPMVEHAFALAQQVHSGTKRKNGSDNFFGHILPVALYLLICEPNDSQVLLTESVLTAALLHDVVEDSGGAYVCFAADNSLEKLFSFDVAALVSHLTKVPKSAFLSPETFPIPGDYPVYIASSSLEQSEYRNKLYAKQLNHAPLQAKVIKCADRLLNITNDIENSKNHTNSQFTQNYINETTTYYLPLFKTVVSHNPQYFRVLTLILAMFTTMDS